MDLRNFPWLCQKASAFFLFPDAEKSALPNQNSGPSFPWPQEVARASDSESHGAAWQALLGAALGCPWNAFPSRKHKIEGQRPEDV